MNTTSRILTALAAGALALAAPACSPSDKATDAGGKDGRLTVVTAFYPLQYVAEQVAGDRAEVTTLTAPGSEPHDLELTAKQVASLSGADLVVYQKGFQGAVDKAVEQAQPSRVLDASAAATLLPAEGSDGHDHEGESAEEHAGHAEDAHEHGSTDPHIWLDPTVMARIADQLAGELSAADAQNADTYTANAKRLGQQLTALDKSFTTGLASCQRQEFITSHAAFGYLAKRYGLTQIGISGLAPESDPSPARIAQVQKLARQHGVTTIFHETLASPSHAKAIAGDLGLRTDVLDPIEGITPESKGSDYIAVQKANLAALRTANGCK